MSRGFGSSFRYAALTLGLDDIHTNQHARLWFNGQENKGFRGHGGYHLIHIADRSKFCLAKHCWRFLDMFGGICIAYLGRHERKFDTFAGSTR